MEDINDLMYEDDPLDGSDFESSLDSGDDRIGNYIADTDDDDPIHNVQTNDDDEPNYPETSVLSEFLKTKGISDPSKINFEDENGNITEVAWDDLDKDTKLNILQQRDSITDELDDAELDLVNRIRLSGMSVEDYLTLERQKGINAYVSQQEQEQHPVYSVDSYSDDDLFMLDLQTKVEDITDEELVQALNTAKANPDIFAKQVQGLRNEYKRLEEEKNERDAAIAQERQEAEFAEFSNSIANSINNFNSLGDLDIAMENEDAEELYEFITGTDAAGINHFYKAINDPDTLTRVAWFALHGEDVMQSISNYYSNAIAQANKSGYERGYKEAKEGKKQSVFVTKSSNKQDKTESIDQLNY